MRHIAPILPAVALGLGLAGCMTSQSGDAGASVGALSIGDALPGRSAEAWRERYHANPSDADLAIRYARALRAQGLRAQALAVLEGATAHNPKHLGLVGAYGRALADAGQYRQAVDVLAQGHPPGRPDWRILSLQGAALDQLGSHEEARRYYATALSLAPDEPSVLSNLGLSYALSKDLVRAESTLRRAVDRPGGDARARRSLAVVVGLQGRTYEAEHVAPSDGEGAKIASLQRMLAQQNGWKDAEPGGRSTLRAEGS
jgi:Flp pilus assembly protein TadD